MKCREIAVRLEILNGDGILKEKNQSRTTRRVSLSQ